MDLLTQAQPDVMTGLVSNGPFAALTGLLLWWILNAWRDDRNRLDKALAENTATIHTIGATLGEAVDRLEQMTLEQRRVAQVLEGLEKRTG